MLSQNGEMWFEKISACVMRILRNSRYAFAISCRFNDLYFELFHGISILFHIHIELFWVISMSCPIHVYYAFWFRFDPVTGTVFLVLLYFDLQPGPKMLFQGDTPEGSDTFQWPVIERDRVGGLRLMIWEKVKVPLCHYSDATEESNLWTAWQLFPLDDD